MTFRCVNGGLSTLDAAPPAGFSVLDAAGAQIPVQARITASDTVCVQLPEGMDIAEVHFAMTNMAYAAQGNLCGRERTAGARLRAAAAERLTGPAACRKTVLPNPMAAGPVQKERSMRRV